MMELITISSLLFVLIAIVECGMIYRRYEKQHPTKNYTQIVEIFETMQRPPFYSENEKALNDFLGRDAFKNDMNCTKINDTEEVMTTTTQVPSTTTTRHTIPTTIYRRSPTETTTMKSPNLDQLFTIRPTKTTIRPNPKENENPDYTELYNWATPHVQVTKHSPSTEKPLLIFIKETDDVQFNQTTTTMRKIEEEETTVAAYDDNHEENGYESDNETMNGENDEEEEEDDEYDENNYDILKDHEQMGNSNYDQEEGDESDDEFDDDLDAKKRRKRLNLLRKRRAHKRKV